MSITNYTENVCFTMFRLEYKLNPMYMYTLNSSSILGVQHFFSAYFVISVFKKVGYPWGLKANIVDPDQFSDVNVLNIKDIVIKHLNFLNKVNCFYGSLKCLL